jgi:hypothetical protein
VSQVPLISGHDNLRALVRADFIAGLREQFEADRLARFNGEPPVMVPVVAEGDHLVPAELAIAAYEKAHQPKELVILPGGHFDAYTVGFETSSGRARDWFVRHLAP